MSVIYFLLACSTLLGHAALWVGFVNRLHSTAAPRWMVKSLSAFGYSVLCFLPLAVFGIWALSPLTSDQWFAAASNIFSVQLYAGICNAVAALTIVLWLQRRWRTSLPDAIRENHTTVIDVAAKLGNRPLAGFRSKLLSLVPGNQVLQIAVHEKHCALKRLPPALDGISIAHLSDLHITGRIGIDFFHEVARQTNALQPDLIAVTGDLVDEIELVDWLPEIFSQLSAPLGIYFVLGNHDLFTRHPQRIRHALTSIGLVDLGSRWTEIAKAGSRILMAGNELPWFSPAAEMQSVAAQSTESPQFRILLAHSPDQFGWARRWDFDLVFAGHTHGGQIAPPLIGPIVSPSWHGVRYASGTFFKPPTLMHVSRGISAELPIRLNCPPELTKLILRCGR